MTTSANARLAWKLAAVVVVMVALSFAAVPFYSWFCRTTGYGGTPSVAEAAPDTILDRQVTVRFDANVAPTMPWHFRPMQREMTIRLGETGLAFYEAYNPTNHPVAGQAAFNVAPDSAGKYFDKIACFCFNLQVLGPGERVEMPVTFFVDPEMLKDSDAARLKAITLSYTMFPAVLPEDTPALTIAPASAAGIVSPPDLTIEH
ncbi:cytochrome c oxidase assembly protein [uncultured Amaricoccus sp.]|uniref:cytochrome c oxidase assembly protein n=1 Tax=uncultured Amaricoccus sp. TaxID=339341 RepID=UPI0026368D67|nr:cytochrome c oxidase assembly protein [uncultured Amaricoccus sp.]